MNENNVKKMEPVNLSILPRFRKSPKKRNKRLFKALPDALLQERKKENITQLTVYCEHSLE